MANPVTDVNKIVTDPVLIKHLTEQGIDSQYVEFCQDYAKENPYAKDYRDLQSGKHFAVISKLPMVNADGVACVAGWTLSKGTYNSSPNQFNASVTGTQVTITLINNQPSGALAGNTLTFSPYLYRGTTKKTCGSPTLLAVDPINENYTNNTLEWDYGICKRRLRLIEGMIQGTWVFESNPNASLKALDIKIVYNQKGSFKLKLGQYATDADTETIPASVFAEATYPLTIGDTLTVYPDAHTETTTVDGYVSHTQLAQTWSTIRNGAGTTSGDASTSVSVVAIQASTTSNMWTNITRAIYLLDVSSTLLDGATISSAVFGIYGAGKVDTLSCTPNLNIYSSAPASNTALVAGDYDSLGTTAYCDTPITYSGFSTTGYNNWTLNTAGLSALATAISGDGILKLGTRNANYDVANTAPTWVSSKNCYFTCYFAEQGTGYKPKLVITYTPAFVPHFAYYPHILAH